MATSRRSDFAASLTGLVVGGCVLFALLFGIVVLTSHRYPATSSAESAQ